MTIYFYGTRDRYDGFSNFSPHGFEEAARMMALAYDNFLYPPKLLNCFVAGERQLQIWEGGNLGVTEKIGFKAPCFQDGFSCGRIFA